MTTLYRYKHYTEVPSTLWRWPSFTPREMADGLDGSLVVNVDFMGWLQDVRYEYGYPMLVSSGYRTEGHQQLLPGGRITGAHVDASAADVKVYGSRANRLIGVACNKGVLGLGISQKGAYSSRYLHLDMWTTAPKGVRPNVWSY